MPHTNEKNRVYFSKDEMLGNHNGVCRIYWHDNGNYYTHSISKKIGTDELYRYVEFDLPLMYKQGEKVHLCTVPVFVGKKVMRRNMADISRSFDKIFLQIAKRSDEQDNGKPYDVEIGIGQSVSRDIMRAVMDILTLCDPIMPKSAADVSGVCIDRYLTGKLA